MTALSQGFMLGLYVMGLSNGLGGRWPLRVLTAVFLTVGYSFIGAAWLILKTEGALQMKAVDWAQGGIWGVVLGMAAISAATPLVSAADLRQVVQLSRDPAAGARCRSCRRCWWACLWSTLRRLPTGGDRLRLGALRRGDRCCSRWRSSAWPTRFYPYVVPEQIDDLGGGERAGKPVRSSWSARWSCCR